MHSVPGGQLDTRQPFRGRDIPIQPRHHQTCGETVQRRQEVAIHRVGDDRGAVIIERREWETSGETIHRAPHHLFGIVTHPGAIEEVP